MSEVLARTWTTPPAPADWPELGLPEIAARSPIGLCFSGGGTRALAAAWGQLRALKALGVLDQARWISGVSGGSWAAGIYTFQRQSDEATLLGEPADPASLTLAELSVVLDASSLGHAATYDVSGWLRAGVHDAGSQSRQWGRAVGVGLLAPYGLYDTGTVEALVASAEHADEILSRPGNRAALGGVQLRAPSPDRPFLVVNACVLGPERDLPLAEERPIPIEFTPWYAGIAGTQTGVFRSRHGALKRVVDAIVGDTRPGTTVAPLGGWIGESFAFGGAPAALRPGVQSVPAPASPWSLADVLGASSSAWAGVLEEFPGLGELYGLAPRATLWPGWTWRAPPADDFALGDGGILENFGIPALLRRGAERLWVFVNTATPLATDWEPGDDAPKSDQMDAYLPALFGRPVASVGTTTVDNLVLDPSGFAPLVRALQAERKAGRPVIARLKHRVVPNPVWGLSGGGEVGITWVYLDRVPAWEARLCDPELCAAVSAGERAHLSTGPLRHFPHYATSEENWGHGLALTAVQARTLAELTCWGVLSWSNARS